MATATPIDPQMAAVSPKNELTRTNTSTGTDE
jgi:hypothetical protein